MVSIVQSQALNMAAPNFLTISPDSVRIYIDTSNAKGAKGGFAVGGLSSTGKNTHQQYLTISSDSTRIYVEENNSKGAKGGFAVSSVQTGKSNTSSFLFLEPDNYFIGHDAGASNTAGLYNSFMGFEAG